MRKGKGRAKEKYLNQPVSFFVWFAFSAALHCFIKSQSNRTKIELTFAISTVIRSVAALTSYYVIIILSELLKAHIASTHQLTKPFIVFLFILPLARRRSVVGSLRMLTFSRLFLHRIQILSTRAFTFSGCASLAALLVDTELQSSVQSVQCQSFRRRIRDSPQMRFGSADKFQCDGIDFHFTNNLAHFIIKDETNGNIPSSMRERAQ